MQVSALARRVCAGLCLALAGPTPDAISAPLPKCFFVSSYHRGYAWSDGVEQGLRSVLEKRCEIRQFDMDSKRRMDEVAKRKAAAQARDAIEEWQPDVVIVADDNATKYLLQAHYREHPIPFVFCGVNWTAEEYGLPYGNSTGMIEVAPLRRMLEQAVAVSGGYRALYIGARSLSETKNLEQVKAATRSLGVSLDSVLVRTMNEWEIALRESPSYDFVVLGSNAGISGWDDGRARLLSAEHARRLTVTNHPWMLPYTMLGFTKLPEEQGQWAGELALEILAGTPPGRIPIIANRKSDIWLNESLLRTAAIEVPRSLRFKAKRVSAP